MQLTYKKLGSYIRELKVKNSDKACSDLRGVSIGKEFMPSVANIHGTDLSKYKRVNKHQFAFNPMHVGRDEVLPIALLAEDGPIIVSPAYVVFEVQDQKALLPEYLMMWCRRTEFDRNAWFTTDSSVRGGFSWESFCNMELPIPSIEKQREIVKEYHTVVDRIRLNERLNEKLEETAQAIYRQWFVDFEFPMTAEYAESIGKPELAGQPYKYSGGEMEYNEVLEQEIPSNWRDACIQDFCVEMKSGGTPNRGTDEYWNVRDIPWLKTGEVSNCVIVDAEEYISTEGLAKSSAKLLPVNSVLMAMYGDGKTKGQVGYLRFESTTNQACCAMICDDEAHSSFLFYHLRFNRDVNASFAIGGAQENLSKTLIASLPLIVPDDDTLTAQPLLAFINRSEVHIRETILLEGLRSLLLSRMATQGAA